MKRRRCDDSPDRRSDVEVIDDEDEPDLDALREAARQAKARTISIEDRE
jgi:hypothetical protein